MIVRHMTNDGLIKLGRMGWSDSTIASARRVDIHPRDGRVTGVTGHVAIHLQENKNGGGKEPAWKDIYVDIGAGSREKAMESVRIGDPVTYAEGLATMEEGIVTGRAHDNRIGGLVIDQVMKRLRDERAGPEVNEQARNS